MPKLQNDPIINNGSSALSVIVSESSVSILTELVLTARDTFLILFKKFQNFRNIAYAISLGTL